MAAGAATECRVSRPRLIASCGLALMALLAAYAPDMGRGFIKDDFAWIAGSRVDALDELPDLLRRDNGFYRPLVALTFALDERLYGLCPFGYATTNLLLALLAAWAVAGLARALGLDAGAALAAACAWAFNPHGIGAALMWISGRTALLLTLWALLAARACVRGRVALAALFVFLALLSKEEATLLPFVLAAWAWLGPAPSVRRDGRRAAWMLAACAPAAGLYLFLRSGTRAYWPHQAPDFYRPTLDVATLARNLVEYADRAGTFAVALVLLAALAAGVRPRADARARRVIVLGAVWVAGGYGLTVLLPVRSSLYAVFPSVGAAIAAAALLRALAVAADRRGRRRLGVAAAVVLLALVPLLHSRNLRARRTAELSTRALAAVTEVAPELASGQVLVLRDGDARVNLRAAFGTLADTAVRLHTGIAARVWIEPPPLDWRTAGLTPPGEGPRVELVLRAGELSHAR